MLERILYDTIPTGILKAAGERRAILADWAAGPSFVIRRTRRFQAPVTILAACTWLEQFRHFFRGAAVVLEGGAVLWFTPPAFSRYDEDSSTYRNAGCKIQREDGRQDSFSIPLFVPAHLLKRPFPGSFWVAESRLLAGCYPGDMDTGGAADKLYALAGLGVRRFINLMEPDETSPTGQILPSYETEAVRQAERLGATVEFVHHPIPGQGVPSRDRLAAILDEIDRPDPPGAVYVHSRDGGGRIGTVVGCWLARHPRSPGVTGRTALERLAAARKEPYGAKESSSPETTVQIELVSDWEGEE